MKVEFFNCPTVKYFNPSLLPKTRPEFLGYQPSVSGLENIVQEYKDYQNILIIGHGGSITSFYGLYHAQKQHAIKQAYFLNTVDPDYIYELKQQLKPENTVVVAISKSGETITQLEALNQFLKYPLLAITEKESPLYNIATLVGGRIIPHPPIGGRYTGFTEVGLLPALLCGLDAESFLAGANEIYADYGKDNIAWQVANVFWQLEQAGYVDVFMPFYSHSLFPLSTIVVQLCHESFGKDGKGQTYVAFEAPESQHHTNQRFFGGIKNMAGLFVSPKQFNHEGENQFSEKAQSVPFKDKTLASVSGVSFSQAMQAELQGTTEDARQSGIPVVVLQIETFEPKEIARFLAFWQLYAVYSSLLRSVDPFNQPQVETSKNISFARRLEIKNSAVKTPLV